MMKKMSNDIENDKENEKDDNDKEDGKWHCTGCVCPVVSQCSHQSYENDKENDADNDEEDREWHCTDIAQAVFVQLSLNVVTNQGPVKSSHTPRLRIAETNLHITDIM